MCAPPQSGAVTSTAKRPRPLSASSPAAARAPPLAGPSVLKSVLLRSGASVEGWWWSPFGTPCCVYVPVEQFSVAGCFFTCRHTLILPRPFLRPGVGAARPTHAELLHAGLCAFVSEPSDEGLSLLHAVSSFLAAPRRHVVEKAVQADSLPFWQALLSLTKNSQRATRAMTGQPPLAPKLHAVMQGEEESGQAAALAAGKVSASHPVFEMDPRITVR